LAPGIDGYQCFGADIHDLEEIGPGDFLGARNIVDQGDVGTPCHDLGKAFIAIGRPQAGIDIEISVATDDLRRRGCGDGMLRCDHDTSASGTVGVAERCGEVTHAYRKFTHAVYLVGNMRSQTCRSCRSVEQSCAKRQLDLANAAREGGLGNIPLLARGLERTMFCHRKNIFDPLEPHSLPQICKICI
jgi:hypothetical protein